MNTDLIIKQEETMTSIEIAEITGKPHNDVMKAIRKMESAWEKVNGGNFSLVEYQDKKGETRPCYALTRTECLYIATKFNDEARAKLVLRWESLEKERMAKMPAVPTSFSQALMLAAQQQEQIEQQQKEIETKDHELKALASSVTTMKNKVAYLDMVLACPSTVKVKVIAQDYGMSAIAFNRMLQNYRIQYKCGNDWILYSNYITLGYVKDVPFQYQRANGSTGLASNTQWTQKGRLFLYEFLKGKGILPLIEQQNASVTA